MRYKSFLAIMLLLVPLWSQAGSFNIGIDTIAVEQGNSSLILIVDSPLDMEDADPGDGLCATAMATCTLRAAVEESNAYPGPDSITLPAGTYIVSSNLPVTDDVSVVGKHRNTTIIDANGADFAFVTIPPTSDVTIESVTVQGSTQAGIDIPFGSLSLIASRVRDNSGHGVRCDSVDGIETVSILNSEILANGLDGVYLIDCNAWIVESTISYNQGRGVFAGEGMYASAATLENSHVGDNLDGGLSGWGLAGFTLESTTVANNLATNGAGYRSDGCSILNSVNSTFSGNRATGHGGGIYLPFADCGVSTLSHTTIAENVADSDDNGTGDGGGIFSAAEEVFNGFILKGTLVANNVDLSGQSHDCAGPEALISAGFNLIGDTAGCLIAGDVSSNLTNLDPDLGPLADNGGDTLTHRLLIQSPAINVIPSGDCTTVSGALVEVDQRGVSRPQPPGCDIGSVEVGFFYDGFETGDFSGWSSSTK